MQESYAAAISTASTVLSRAILTTEGDLRSRVRTLDALIRDLLREIGRLVFAGVVNDLGRQAVDEAKTTGLTPHRRFVVRYACLFGLVDVESLDLYDRKARRSSRPMQDVLGIGDGGRSLAVERALTEFGSEDSFGLAARRFEEHYGWTVDRGCVRRVTRKSAAEAEEWVASRLVSGEAAFAQSLAQRPGAGQVLAELDGCEIRTGTLSDDPHDGTTPQRGIPRRRREERWREVRVGLARPLDEDDATYVARMGKYPELVRSVFQAAVSRGLSSRSETIVIADGANGLLEEMASQFPNATCILDQFHLVQHLYEMGDAMGLVDPERVDWVKEMLARLSRGEAQHVIGKLREIDGTGSQRAQRLIGYLDRFRRCVHYDAYRERGFPVGSGEVESAHRSIPQRRLKLSGACWHPDSINPMLALRVVKANDAWNDFWEHKQPA